MTSCLTWLRSPWNGLKNSKRNYYYYFNLKTVRYIWLSLWSSASYVPTTKSSDASRIHLWACLSWRSSWSPDGDTETRFSLFWGVRGDGAGQGESSRRRCLPTAPVRWDCRLQGILGKKTNKQKTVVRWSTATFVPEDLNSIRCKTVKIDFLLSDHCRQ